MGEIIIQNRAKRKKIIPLRKYYDSRGEIEKFVKSAYRGHTLLGVWDRLFSVK